MNMQPNHSQFRCLDPSAERKAPAGRPRKLPGPKPVQAYCRLCERLFCYFKITAPRLYCTPCVDIERRLEIMYRRDKRAAARRAKHA